MLTKKNKKGILFRIPIFLFLCGLAIIVFASWKLIKQTYFLKTDIFNNHQLKIAQKQFRIDGKMMKRPDLGSTFGEVLIPSISLDYPLIHGDRPEDLEKGIGQYAGSTLPGEGGNVVIDGHRDTVFRKLGSLKIGDIVTIRTAYGTYNYKVTKFRIVNPDDKTVIVKSDKEMLTMYTCYPFVYIGQAPQRYVVEAEYVKN